jgi:hypothetical protein
LSDCDGFELQRCQRAEKDKKKIFIILVLNCNNNRKILFSFSIYKHVDEILLPFSSRNVVDAEKVTQLRFLLRRPHELKYFKKKIQLFPSKEFRRWLLCK